MRSKLNDSLTSPIADPLAMQKKVSIRMGSQPGSNSIISIVHPAGLSTETQQTSGSLRMSAIAMNGIPSWLWEGIFVVEPSGKTGIHHHGEQDTVVYVLEGETTVRWGPLENTPKLLARAIFCMCQLVAASGTKSF